MTSIKLFSLVTTPSLAVLLPTNGSMSYVNICTGNGIDPTMSSFSIADYLRLLLHHPIIIPSPRQAVYGQPCDVHGDYIRIATVIMNAMSKSPCSSDDVDRSNVYRVVISCSESVSEKELDRRSDSTFSLIAGGPNEERDEILGSTGGVYILTFEEMLVFVVLFALHPSFDADNRHQDEHDRNRLRRYSFITAPLHMMYGYNNNIAGRNWLPTYFLNQYVGDEDIGSHKYYPFINHLHVYHRVAEGVTRLTSFDDASPFRKLAASFRLFAILAFQSCGSNIANSRASPSVRVRNALMALTISNTPNLAAHLVSRTMNDRYSAVARNVERNMNMLQTTGDRTRFFSIFFEFCMRLPIQDWIEDTRLTYRKLIDHHHMTPLVVEVFTMAEMVFKCEQDEDMDAYISLRREVRSNVETGRMKWLQICLTTRDHHRPMVVEARVVLKVRPEELQNPSAARVHAQLAAEGHRKRVESEYLERVLASYALRSTFNEECKVFVLPGVSRLEFLASCNRMMPVVLLLVNGDMKDFGNHVHTCVDSTNRTTSCYAVMPPTCMYILATVAKLQMHRMMLDKPDAQHNEAAILTSVMEILAVSVRYVGVQGVWILLHSFFIHFSMFRYAQDENKFDYRSSSRLDGFGAASPKDHSYNTMTIVLLLWRLVIWNRDAHVRHPAQWKLQCDTLIHGLVRNNKLNDNKYKVLLSKFASELNSLHVRHAFKDEAAVDLLCAASNDWAQLNPIKDVLLIAQHKPISCVMRSINYHTGGHIAGSYAPTSSASAVCALPDVEVMMVLVEFSLGLDGNWMKHAAHHSLFTTDTVMPSRQFFAELPMCVNHASHPTIMRETIALIADPLLQTAFTEVMITNIRNKFESREKKMRDEDDAAAAVKRKASELASSSSSSRRHHSRRRRRHERTREDSDDSSSDRDESKERFSPAQGAFSPPPSPGSFTLGPAAMASTSTTHVPSHNYVPGVSPSYQSGFDIDTHMPTYVPTTPNDPPPPATADNEHHPGAFIGSITSPEYVPDANREPVPPSPNFGWTNSSAWATHSAGARMRNCNPASPSYDPFDITP